MQATATAAAADEKGKPGQARNKESKEQKDNK